MSGYFEIKTPLKMMKDDEDDGDDEDDEDDGDDEDDEDDEEDGGGVGCRWGLCELWGGGGAARGEHGWGAGPRGQGRGWGRCGGREAGGGGGELISKSQIARGVPPRFCKKPEPKITNRKGCPPKGFCIK